MISRYTALLRKPRVIHSHCPFILVLISARLHRPRSRYHLDLRPASPEFGVWDTAEEVHGSLNELSTAARIRLLLAGRLAFTEGWEPGPMLPVLFDERLADSGMHGRGRPLMCRRRAEVAGIPVHLVDLSSDCWSLGREPRVGPAKVQRFRRS